MDAKTIDPRLIRQSPIAGKYYPGSSHDLGRTVDNYLSRAEYFATGDDVVALISSSSGYLYSGQTAAYAHCQLRGCHFDTVVLLGGNHADLYPAAVAISNYKYYATPLGTVELDHEFIGALAQKIQVQRIDQDQEYSLEIQLPFLQRMLGDFRLVPLILGFPFYNYGEGAIWSCEQLATVLAELGYKKKVLFIASSDLSHLDNYENAKKFDARTADLVASFDVPRLARHMWEDGECRADGDVAIITTLLAAKALCADSVHMLCLTNSGDVDGSREHSGYVVGYMAAAVYRSRSVQISSPPPFIAYRVPMSIVPLPREVAAPVPEMTDASKQYPDAYKEYYAWKLMQKMEKEHRAVERRVERHLREIGRYK